MQHAVVIGAGIAGLAAALRLRHLGLAVTVFENNPYPGGKLTEIQLGDFRFDAGPSLFTMPHFLEEIFQLWDRKTEDYLPYERLDVITEYFWEDGTRITAHRDPEKFAQEIERKTGEPAEHILRFLRRSKKAYELTEPIFLKNALHEFSTLLRPETLKAILNIGALDLNSSMHEANREAFGERHVVQLFDRYATYNGSDPYQAPATLNVIPHLEFNIGAFFPKNGMHSITQSLFRLGKEVGIQYNFNSAVSKITTKDNKVTGIEVNGTRIAADFVVSNADVVNTYRRLLPQEKHPVRLLNQPKSSSALIFYWGIQGSFPELDLHNIFFTEDYKSEFYHIFQKETLFDDPTIYINISSKHRPEDAPSGCENWFVMINTPHHTGQNWERLIPAAKEAILKKLSRMLGRDIAPLIVEEDYLSPLRIESRTQSTAGALYGNSSNNRMAAFLRHANRSRQIPGLYFCGGSVHPGGGIPLCMLSAKIVGDLVEGEL